MGSGMFDLGLVRLEQPGRRLKAIQNGAPCWYGGLCQIVKIGNLDPVEQQ
jgi:hypothetical protein